MRLDLTIEADGSVESARVHQSSGHEILDEAALEIAGRSRFRAPGETGRTAPILGRISYRFALAR